MKTFIKILLAVAVLNAVVHVGMVYSSYYQLKDAALQLVTFGERAAPADIQAQLIQKAAELNVPVNPDNVSVKRADMRTTASVTYTQSAEVFPSYQYPMDFSFSVDAYAMSGLK